MALAKRIAASGDENASVWAIRKLRMRSRRNISRIRATIQVMVISEIWLKLYLGLAKVLVAVNRKRRSPEVYLKALLRILNFAVAISYKRLEIHVSCPSPAYPTFNFLSHYPVTLKVIENYN